MLTAVTDELLVDAIASASSKLDCALPALSATVAEALFLAVERLGADTVRILIDVDEDAYRIGYGDPAGARALVRLTGKANVLRQPGLRLGVLVTDDEVIVWSPSPLSIERERSSTEPNGVRIARGAVGESQIGGLVEQALAGQADDSESVPRPVLAAEVERVVESLERNPPAPFDLSRVTRVFSSRYQFVEMTLRGAGYTKSEITLSSVLLNSDVPESLRSLLDTKFRPFGKLREEAVAVPLLIDGEAAFRADGSPMLQAMTQAELRKEYQVLRRSYLREVKQFGWILAHSEKAELLDRVAAFEVLLREWVTGFRERAAKDEELTLADLAALIGSRLAQSKDEHRPSASEIRGLAEDALQRLRMSEPEVKLVFKNVAPESTQDSGFLAALEEALGADEMRDWYETFEAAPERDTGANR